MALWPRYKMQKKSSATREGNKTFSKKHHKIYITMTKEVKSNFTKCITKNVSTLWVLKRKVDRLTWISINKVPKWQNKFPPQGLEPWSPAWEASMLTTYTMAECCFGITLRNYQTFVIATFKISYYIHVFQDIRY